ncbi:hypothetical protein SRABI118_04540 [Massilia sp. Bi118]|uniref:SIR2 family NAD-dependent protein deacylase n=1 Tax=Massilia sp. Bi118 TaxID=2822346 RepID=UPI001D20902B|nr:SIR2 family protein [Massilia sp. Bi118]CAH0304853.1 hypothetical protein SRABI118_04540 [Massilia sp. Bi118]
MNAYFEIAYAAVTNRLCLFTGTGFSKAVTENKAPSWQGLLEQACGLLPNGSEIISALFPKDGENPLSLEEAAQVISLQFAKRGKVLHDDIAEMISKLECVGDNAVIEEFFKTTPLRVVTTNYDLLAEDLAGAERCQSISPGFPIPRSSTPVKVFHVHGSVESPLNMVVTSDDYFRFMTGETYFSRKLSTVLHENTVVILGYSLADTNLKTIINDYKRFSRSHVIGGNLFLVSRGKVAGYLKEYYAHCYGIRVIDSTEIHVFFEKLTNQMAAAKKCAVPSIEKIKKVLENGDTYEDSYLGQEQSFYEVTASVAAIGRSINDDDVVAALGEIIKKKIGLTGATGAWEQYQHLARWLCHLGTILELPGTSIEAIYLKAVLKSMDSMSNKFMYGSSWDAYKAWDARWPNILWANRALIKGHIEAKCYNDDALEIVGRE